MEKINIYAFADEASPMIDEQIKAMQSNSLDGLEIRNVDNVNVSDISDSKAKEVKEKLDVFGLKTWSIGSPIGKIDIEKDSFDVHIEKFKRTLEIAQILNAENIRLFSFYISKDKNPEDYKNKVIERLVKLCDIAKDSGIILCHENEKGIYGDNASRCYEILKALPDIKGIFDPANFVQCGQDTIEAWKLLSPYIKYLHIKDSLDDSSVVPSGFGKGNISYIFNEFYKNGGRNVTIEPHLTVFDGLSDLEQKGEESKVGNKFKYNSKEEAFNAAVLAFKNILE